MNTSLVEQALRIHYPGSDVSVEINPAKVRIRWRVLDLTHTVHGFSVEDEKTCVHEIVLACDAFLVNHLIRPYRPEENAAQKFIEEEARWQDLTWDDGVTGDTPIAYLPEHRILSCHPTEDDMKPFIRKK